MDFKVDIYGKAEEMGRKIREYVNTLSEQTEILNRRKSVDVGERI